MKKFKVKRKPVEITAENINDLLTTAFEGGINYWCSNVEILNLPREYEADKIYASDAIAIGGELRLYDAESSDTWVLTLGKFLSGVEKTLEWGKFASVEDMMDNHDAETADVLIQYALFNEIVFG